MQRAKVVKVIIFIYGVCLERGLLLRIYRSVVNLLYLALFSLWPYHLVALAYVRCCRLLGVPYLRFFIWVFSEMLSHGHLFHVPVIHPFRTI